MKNNKLLKYFKTQEQFDAQSIYVEQGDTEEEYIDQNGETQWGDADIYPEHICFIEDTKTIFTHNTKYCGNSIATTDELGVIKVGENLTISEDGVLTAKGYFFDDLKKSFTEGYNELNFYDYGADAEVITLSGGTPTNEFKTTRSDLIIGDIIRIDGVIYKIIEKSIEDDGSCIYTVNLSYISNGGRIYVLTHGAVGFHSHTEGDNTIASGSSSHTEGTFSYAEGDFSHAEGSNSHTKGQSSHAEGQNTIAINTAEHAEGEYNKSNTGTRSSIGIGTADNNRKNAFEVMDNGDTFIYGVGEYDGTNINTTNTKGERLPASIQEVLPKYNKENRSVCFQYNEADDSLNEAQADYSFVIGYNNKAIREETDENGLTQQAGNTFVGGMNNRAYHSNCIVFGEGLYTQFGNTFVLGKYNGTVSNQDGWGDTVLGIVGDGYKDSNGTVTGRNVLLLQGGGDPALHCRGGFKNNASWINDFGEYFEWLDGNPDNEDRIGYMVQLNGDKIELAESLEKCIGVISGTTGFIGGVCSFEWHNKFLHDKWGREIIGEDGNPVINPDYNPDLEYIPREQRKEWDVVGLVGQVVTRQDGTLEVGGYAGCNNGIATNATSGFKVLKIIDSETALLLVK